MLSMTGFGNASYREKTLNLEVSVKTVNGRYLDIKVFGPRIYQEIESEIKKVARKYLKRGTIEIGISRRSQGHGEQVSFNAVLAEQWLGGFKKVAKKLNVDSEVNAEILLQIPDFFKVEESSTAIKVEQKHLLATLKKALESCAKERQREGAKLKKDLGQYLTQLQKNVVDIKKLRAKSLAEMKQRFDEKLKKLLQGHEFDEGRIIQEVTMLVDRTDVAEEIKRLEAHLVAIKKLLSNNDSIGKKLDFYAQELLREINTIGSKSYSASLTTSVVNAKDLVEKFREQVQNIE